MRELLGAACVGAAQLVVDVFAAAAAVGVGVADLVVVGDAVVVRAALQEGSEPGGSGSRLHPSSLLPPRITDRSSLEKLVLSMETCPPSKPVAPAVLAGSCAC